MKVSKEDLLPYLKDRKAAAKKFGVCERTVVRWLQIWGLYEPKENYGCGKLDLQKAEEIRRKHKEGASVKDLAKEYSVTFSSISRVIHNITYKKQQSEKAEVSVVYNPR